MKAASLLIGLLGLFGTLSAQGQSQPAPSLLAQINLRLDAGLPRWEYQRVIQGRVVAPGDHDWEVALISARAKTNEDGYFCAGALIAERTVLTAAHCFSSTTTGKDFVVLVGTHNLGKGGQLIEPETPLIADNYSPLEGRNDLAIVHLKKPAAGVPLLAVASDQDPVMLVVGAKAAIAGWGPVTTDGKVSIALSWAPVPIVSNTVCNDVTSYNGIVTDQMFCAGYAAGSGANACSGDSGSPVTIVGVAAHAVGITLGGDECGLPGRYGIYTRVSSYSKWIADNQQWNGP